MKTLITILILCTAVSHADADSFVLEELTGEYSNYGSSWDQTPSRSVTLDIAQGLDEIDDVLVIFPSSNLNGLAEICGVPDSESAWTWHPVLTLESAGVILAQGVLSDPVHENVFEFLPVQPEGWDQALAGPVTITMSWAPDEQAGDICPLEAPWITVWLCLLFVDGEAVAAETTTFSSLKSLYR